MSTPLQKLFGDRLTNAAGEDVQVEGLGASVVGVYFSASWCGPCQAFTPELVAAYQAFKEKGAEVVFVSSDRDTESFQAYLQKMPWLAVPFGDKKVRAKLSQRFKVQGIPTFVLVDAATGRVICKDGRAALSADPELKDFPWRPKPTRELLPAELVRAGGERVPTAEALNGVDVLGFYMSAHWCPPCRHFTPQLVETYKRLKAQGKTLEIVFVSSDRDQASFDSYLEEMPWLAVPFDERHASGLIKEKFSVQGIPTLIFMEPSTDRVINESGRAAVSVDPEGKDYPWFPKPVQEVTPMTAAGLSDAPAVIAHVPKDAPAETREAVVAALEQVAADFKDAGDDLDRDMVSFYWTGGDEIVDRVLQVMGGSFGSGCSLAVLSLAGGRSFESTVPDAKGVTADAVRAFVKEFLDDAVPEDRIVELQAGN